MATGSDTFEGLAVPLHGDSQITQRTAATDILTIQGAASQTGDFLVGRNSSETEKFSITSDGEGKFEGGLAIISSKYLRFSTPVTTPPVTGLTEGDLFVGMGSSTPQIGICYSTAANSLRYITADTKTWGRTTA